jgi:hypothetical protein
VHIPVFRQNSPRRIVSQLAAAGNQLEFLARHFLLSILVQLESPSAVVNTEEQLLGECVYIMMVMGTIGYTRDMALFGRVCEWAYYWVPCISTNGCRQLAVAS